MRQLEAFEIGHYFLEPLVPSNFSNMLPYSQVLV